MLRQRKDWIEGHVSTFVDQGSCPSCKEHLRMVTDVQRGSSEEPRPGAFCVCIKCFALNILDDKLKLRTPTKAEIALAMMDPAFSQVCSVATRDHAKWKARN